MKLVTRILVIAVIFSFVLAACAPAVTPAAPVAPAAKKTIVGLVMKSLANQYFKDMQDGAQKWADANNVDLKPVGIQNETDVDAQIAAVEGLITQKVDIIVLAPANSVALAPVAKKAVDAGITVVNMDVAFDAKALADNGLTGLPYVGPDNRVGSKLAGDALGKFLPKGANVLILEGASGADNATQRTNGFKDSVKEYGMTLVDSLTADWETEKANTVTTTELTAHPDIVGIMCDNDSMVLGAQKAVEAAGLTGKVTIVGFDNIAPVQDLIKQGKVLATVDQFSTVQAVDAIQVGLRMLKGEKVTGWVKTDVKLITAAELGGAAAAAPTAAPAVAPVTVEFWVFSDWASGTAGDLFNTFKKEFEAANPGITINIVGKPGGDIETGTVAGAGTGVEPDVATLGLNFGTTITSTGVIQDVSAQFNAMPDAYKSQFNPAAMKALSNGGKVWGVPFTTYAITLFRNKTILKKAGIDPAAGIKDWADWVSQCDKVKKAGFECVPDMFQDGGFLEDAVSGVGGQNGVSADGKSTTITTAQVQQAIEMIQQMKPYMTQVSNWDQASTDAFTSNKLAFQYCGPWCDGGYIAAKTKNADFDYDYTLIPGATADKFSGTYGGEWIATFKGPRSDAAFKWAAFLADAPQAKRMGTVLGRTVLNNVAMADPEVQKNALAMLGDKATKYVFQDAVWFQFWPLEARQPFTDAIQSVKAGKADAATAAQACIDALNKVLAAGPQ